MLRRLLRCQTMGTDERCPARRVSWCRSAAAPCLHDRGLRASGAIPVDARQPLDQVVDALLSRMVPVPLAGQADSPGPGARGR